MTELFEREKITGLSVEEAAGRFASEGPNELLAEKNGQFGVLRLMWCVNRCF